MNKLVGIVGSGMIGRDPFDPYCWSGSSRNLFLALQSLGILEDAFGVEATKLERSLLALKNYNSNKRVWRNKFNLDPFYYRALTSAVGRKIRQYSNANSFLQIGAIYDVPKIVGPQGKCFSYHDGNIAGLMRSPIFPENLLPQAKKAFAWEHSVYKKMTKIFTMSEYLRHSFIDDFGIPEDRVINVGVGTNFDMSTIPSPDTKDFSKKEVLFIGIDFVRKGGDNLIRAFDTVHQNEPDAILHIVGPRSVRPIIETSTERPWIKFHGFLSRSIDDQRAKFFDLMQRSTLLVLPSLYEPFGIAILEGMAYYMPCIATNKWAFPEMITPNVNGALISNIHDLADEITRYVSNATLRKEHGLAARKVVETTFSWEKVAKNIFTEID